VFGAVGTLQNVATISSTQITPVEVPVVVPVVVPVKEPAVEPVEVPVVLRVTTCAATGNVAKSSTAINAIFFMCATASAPRGASPIRIQKAPGQSDQGQVNREMAVGILAAPVCLHIAPQLQKFHLNHKKCVRKHKCFCRAKGCCLAQLTGDVRKPNEKPLIRCSGPDQGQAKAA